MIGLKLPEQNQVTLIGRLTQDPDLRFTNKQVPVCAFRLAVNRRYKDVATNDWKEEATFVPIVVWRSAAERCKERLKKGSPVQVEGRLRSREYEDKTGQRRTVLEVEARRVQFLAVSSAASVEAGADAVADAPGDPLGLPNPPLGGGGMAPAVPEGVPAGDPPAGSEEVPF